jgi:hypothetical protein
MVFSSIADGGNFHGDKTGAMLVPAELSQLGTTRAHHSLLRFHTPLKLAITKKLKRKKCSLNTGRTFGMMSVLHLGLHTVSVCDK